MKNLLNVLFVSVLLFSVSACSQDMQKEENKMMKENNMMEENNMSRSTKDTVIKTDEEWQKELSDEEYYVLRKKGTERAFTGKYDKFYEEGTYVCAACGQPLFESDAKYNSGSGWPSFWAPASKENVKLEEDMSLGMTRTEVLCSRCGGHLGHVFDDGPDPTGKRYCINSVALDFKSEEK